MVPHLTATVFLSSIDGALVYYRKNLYREAEILSSLRHSNIIQLLETLESDTL